MQGCMSSTGTGDDEAVLHGNTVHVRLPMEAASVCLPCFSALVLLANDAASPLAGGMVLLGGGVICWEMGRGTLSA